jgi:hypothetical protein
MKNFAETRDIGELPRGTNAVFTYTDPWDAEKIQGCKCHSPNLMPDCLRRDCAYGDDPLTKLDTSPIAQPQRNEIQTVKCKLEAGMNEALDGPSTYFTLGFRGYTTTKIHYKATAPQIRAALEALPSIGGVAVSQNSATQACSAGEVGITSITFTQDFGVLPSLVMKAYGKIDFSNSRVTTVLTGTKENKVCSGRGTCNDATGICTCFENFISSDGMGSPGDKGDCGFAIARVEQCPGAETDSLCSFHGVCQDTGSNGEQGIYVCQCDNQYYGADCSRKSCRLGLPWFHYPSADNTAHIGQEGLIECSNAGHCNRATGVCDCLPNFEGDRCQFLKCPGGQTNLCSRRGTCESLKALAAYARLENGEPIDVQYGSRPNDPLTWDAEMIQGCKCNDGYSGYDCSETLCPTGDNPDTIGQIDEQQIFECTDVLGDNPENEVVILTFRGEKTGSIPGNSNSAQVKAALEQLTGIAKVTVEVVDLSKADTMCTSEGNKFLVRFWTEHGDLPLMKIFALQDIDTFVVHPYKDGTKEQIECSGRGICNRVIGECTCFPGYGDSDNMGGVGVVKNCGYSELVSERES